MRLLSLSCLALVLSVVGLGMAVAAAVNVPTIEKPPMRYAPGYQDLSVPSPPTTTLAGAVGAYNSDYAARGAALRNLRNVLRKATKENYLANGCRRLRNGGSKCWDSTGAGIGFGPWLHEIKDPETRRFLRVSGP